MVRTSLLAAFGLIGLAAPAMAFNDGGFNNPPEFLAETIEINIDRFVGNETLMLRQLGGIGPQYSGHTLQSVKVELDQFGPAGQVELLVDGQVVDSAFTVGQQAVFLNPFPNGDVFGQEFQTLHLRTVGWVSIDDIEVNIFQQINFPPPPPPQPVCQSIERQLNTDVRFTQLNLNSLFDLSQHPDCRIDSVTIVANSAFGGGQTMALVGGWQASGWTQVAAFPGQYTIDLWNDPSTGANAQQLALNMMGLFTVQTVRLDLVNN